MYVKQVAGAAFAAALGMSGLTVGAALPAPPHGTRLRPAPFVTESSGPSLTIRTDLGRPWRSRWSWTRWSRARRPGVGPGGPAGPGAPVVPEVRAVLGLVRRVELGGPAGPVAEWTWRPRGPSGAGGPVVPARVAPGPSRWTWWSRWSRGPGGPVARLDLMVVPVEPDPVVPVDLGPVGLVDPVDLTAPVDPVDRARRSGWSR